MKAIRLLAFGLLAAGTAVASRCKPSPASSSSTLSVPASASVGAVASSSSSSGGGGSVVASSSSSASSPSVSSSSSPAPSSFSTSIISSSSSISITGPSSLPSASSSTSSFSAIPSSECFNVIPNPQIAGVSGGTYTDTTSASITQTFDPAVCGGNPGGSPTCGYVQINSNGGFAQLRLDVFGLDPLANPATAPATEQFTLTVSVRAQPPPTANDAVLTLSVEDPAGAEGSEQFWTYSLSPNSGGSGNAGGAGGGTGAGKADQWTTLRYDFVAPPTSMAYITWSVSASDTTNVALVDMAVTRTGCTPIF